jgi:hypothetical protein
LAHVLAAETGNKVSIRELYAEYRAFAVPKSKPRFERVEEELALLKKYVPLYETLEGRRDSVAALSWLGGKLRDWQVTTVYPVAFQIGSAEISNDEKQHIAKLLYSYLARRAICGLSAKNLNNVFQSMASDFLRNGVSLIGFQQFFADRVGDSSRFPDDNELVKGIENANAYAISPKSRLVDILWEFEQATRSGLSEVVKKPGNLWVEHVMPRAWGEEWPFVDSAGNEVTMSEEMENARDLVLDNFGNLTLLSDRLNMSVGKSGFTDKKEKFAEHTGLFLNKWFSDCEKWDEADIRLRSQHMAKLATTIWISLDHQGPI